ncbi:putative uncharacterized protein ART3 [Sesamum alatum]|uniref:Uncharacterized protein n=1 Tax=Sesamum alatum TaxID=300844 RepID=A0AAE1XIM4_9LAMI|nr:putative uncharacterized protein ART3 [Sesamum alatum]
MCKCRSHGTFPLFGLQSSHLNICYYHQDPHRRPLRPGSRPGFCSDRRALLLIGAWLLPRRPGIGRALQRHPFSGLVDSAEDQGRSALHPSGGIAPVSFLAPYGFYLPVDSHTCQTPWSVFQDGSNGEPAGQHRERAVAEARRWRALSATIGATAFRGHIDCPGFGRRLNPRWSAPRADRRTGSRRSTSDRGASPAPIRFPPDNFKHSLTLFSKSFSSFLAVLVRYRSLARSGHDGALTLSGAPFQGTWARSAAEDASPDYNSDSEAARFSSWAIPGSLAVTRGILATGAFGSNVDARADDAGTTSSRVECSTTTGRDGHRRGIAFGPAARRGAREANIRAPSRSGRGATRCVTPRQTCPGLMASGATCVQRLDGSRDSAIHTKYRISLRSSSMREPRYPLPRVVMTFERRPPPPVPRRERRQLAADASLSFPWRVPRRGFVSPHGVRVSARRRGLGPRRGGFPPTPGPRFG